VSTPLQRFGRMEKLSIGRRRVLSRLAAAVWVALKRPPLQAAPATPPDAWTELTLVEDDTGEPTIRGRELIVAQDGSTLVRKADQRLQLLSGDQIRRRQPVDPEPPLPPRDLGRRLIADLPSGFDFLLTRHYLVCFDTNRSYAQWCAALFERLHGGFMTYWKRFAIDLSSPPEPLIVVIFADRRRYEAAAAVHLGKAAASVVGYYDQLDNRVTTFDITGSDLLADARLQSAGRAGLDILASPAASSLIATLVHEATHQLAFNSGLHRRLAPIPVWVSEGIATYFEAPDLTSSTGWRGIGRANPPRRERFLTAASGPLLEALVQGDEPFRQTSTALDAYAHAWALIHFLLTTKRESCSRYMAMLAEKQPLAEEPDEQRIREFVQSFGQPPRTLIDAVSRHVARLA
jgi:hypothetical protein